MTERDVPSSDSAPGATARERSTDDKLILGEKLNGRFLVEELAATGGMGSVYRGRDLDTGAAVAIKALAFAHSPRRFSREASVLSELRHPAVVRYIAHGSSQTGVPCLVMEWLAGEDLSQRLRRKSLTVNESLRLVRRAAEGLASAHAQGVVHRDIKPSNLFVVDDDPAALKVVDFGVARRLESGQTLTRAGNMLGTVGYMAPEQAMGATDVDARADVFALGCVLFECLTGRPAFEGQHDVAVLAKVLREEPPRISQLRPELEGPLDGLLSKLMAKDRAQRPADATELLSLLDTLGEHSAGRPAQQVSTTRLTASEQRIVSAILGRPRGTAGKTLSPDMAETETRSLMTLSERFGADPVPLAGGALLFLMSSHGAATDLAQRAARCSLALSQLRRDLSFAVATGSVDVSGRIPVGVAIDRAAAALDQVLLARETARFDGSSAEEGVALDEATSGLLGARFDVRSLATGTFLIGERDDDAPRLLMGKPTPMVGRDKELGLLEANLAECVNDSVARALLVSGPPGLGKSRLIQELGTRVRKSGTARLLVARADPVAVGATFALLTRLIRQATGLEGGAAGRDEQAALSAYLQELVPGERGHWLSEFLGEVSSLERSDVSPLLRAARNDPEVMREQTRRAFVAWIEAELSRRPLLIVLEDLHWGDASTVMVLQEVLAQLSERPLLIVATARPEVHALFPQLAQLAHFEELRLRGLTRRAAERLVAAALPESVPSPVVERIVGLADGNAFYLEELIRRVAEGGTELPETVLAMAQSRLQLLESAARRLLRAASVFGETFWAEGLCALLGRDADDGYWLEFLVTQEIVSLRGESRFPHQREYAFRHALLRDAAYAMLTPEDRKVAHRLAGEWLERLGEREALVLADHFERGELVSRALPWVQRAALTALEGGDLAGAAALSRRGLSLNPQPEARGVLLLVQAYASALGMKTDIRGLADALALLPKGSPYWWLALSLLIFGSVALGKADDARPYLQLALETPPGPELTGMYGAAMQALAAAMVLAGRPEAAWPLIDRFEHQGPGDPERDLLFSAWLNLARCQLAVTSPVRGTWQLERALHWGRAAEATMRSAGSTSGLVTALFYLGNASRIVGLYAEAELALREGVELATRSGSALLRQYSQLILGLVLIRLHKGSEARDVLLQLQSSPDPNLVHGMQALLAEAAFCDGDFALARREAGEAALGPASPYRRMACCTLARTQLGLHEPAAALEAAQRALQEGAAANPEFEADLLATRAEALWALGQHAEARETLQRADSFVGTVAQQIEDPALRACFLRELGSTARVNALSEAMRSS
jgi:tetratricopeptide (TPR) repeat protein/predicted Ser/Thr protein kinase